MRNTDTTGQTRPPGRHGGRRSAATAARASFAPLIAVVLSALTSLMPGTSPSAVAGEFHGAFFRLPVNLSHSPSPTSLARNSPCSIALDPDGPAYALWVERITHTGGVTREIALSMYNPGAGWDSLATPVAWWDGDASSDPACAIDRGHTMHLVWIDRRPGAPQVFAQLFNPGRAVQTQPLQISDGQGATADPAVAAGPDGWIHTVWSEIRGSTSIVRHRTASPGGSWLDIDGPEIPGEPPAYGPDVAVDSHGHVHLVWEWGATQGVGIGYADWSAAAGWSTGRPLVPVEDGEYAQSPVVAASPDGGLWVAWAVLDREGTSILVRRRSADGEWEEQPRPIARSEIEVVSPALAVDSWGVAHLLWQEALPPDDLGDQTTAIMYAALAPDAPTPTTPPRALSASTGGPHRGPMVVTDTGGRILAAWLDESIGLGDLVSRMGVTGFARPGH